MILANSFFSGTFSTVDAVIGDFVTRAYEHFIQANSSVITLSFVLYVMFIGYEFLSHTSNFNLTAVLKRLILMMCVFGLVMNWRLYHLFVYNIFTNEPARITQGLIGAIDGGHNSGGIVATLDSLYETVIDATIGFLSEVNFSMSGLSFIFYGVLVFVIGSLMCGVTLLLFIYAKMMMAVMLALGPIFILFLMWDSTKGLFSAWLNALITIALIPIVTSAILVLMLAVINVTLPNMSQPAEEMQFIGIAPFLGLCLAVTLILSQVLSISSALGGGISISNLSKGADIAKKALEKSGVAPMARRVAGNPRQRKPQNQLRNQSKGSS